MAVLAHAAYSQSRRQGSSQRPRQLYKVVNNDDKIGFIDKTGNLVIGFDRLPKITLRVGDFQEGRAVIYLKKDGSDQAKGDTDYTVGYIDETGRVIIAPRFDMARDFSEGLAYVEAQDFRGFIDRQGKAVIKVGNPYTRDFHEGLAATASRTWGGEWGYIDRSGRLAIKLQYEFADDFSEGLAGVVVDRKYGFINKRGEMVIPPRFGLRKGGRHQEVIVSSGRFSEGLACVSDGQLYGYINKRGDFVIPPQFVSAQDFSEGLAWVVTRDEKRRIKNKAGWIDKSGRWVVTEVDGRIFSLGLPEFVTYSNELMDWRYSEGLVPFLVYSGEKTLRGYMNRRGEVVIQPAEFGRVWPFVGGVARVAFEVNGDPAWEEDYGYIDRTGRFIWRSK